MRFFQKRVKKKAKILENLGKNVQNLKIFWKRLAHVCDYCTLETARICRLIFFCKFCLLVLNYFMWIKVVASEIVLSKLFTLVFSVLNFVFLTTSLSTVLLNFFNSTGAVFNLPRYKLFTFVFILFRLVGTLTSLLMSS